MLIQNPPVTKSCQLIMLDKKCDFFVGFFYLFFCLATKVSVQKNSVCPTNVVGDPQI